ncbi:MAG: phosphate ABC transporter permease, partial [Gammaproteobacteria bacterium]
MSNAPTENSSVIDKLQPELARRRKWRTLKDIAARYSIGFGGISVIIAIVLIFFYLLYVVLPLFASASITPMSSYPMPGGNDYSTELIALEEQNEIGVRFTSGGHALFFDTKSGGLIEDIVLPIPENTSITSFAQGNPVTRIVAYGLSDGRTLIARHQYQITYPNDQRVITPSIDFPFGEEP